MWTASLFFFLSSPIPHPQRAHAVHSLFPAFEIFALKKMVRLWTVYKVQAIVNLQGCWQINITLSTQTTGRTHVGLAGVCEINKDFLTWVILLLMSRRLTSACMVWLLAFTRSFKGTVAAPSSLLKTGTAWANVYTQVELRGFIRKRFHDGSGQLLLFFFWQPKYPWSTLSFIHLVLSLVTSSQRYVYYSVNKPFSVYRQGKVGSAELRGCNTWVLKIPPVQVLSDVNLVTQVSFVWLYK